MAAEDVNLLHGDGIKEALHDAEDGGEAPGRVDEVELAEAFRVVVLRDGGGLLDVAVHGADAAEADAFQVHDGAAGLEQGAGFAGAGGQARVGDLFVFDDEVLQHAFGRRDLVHGVEVDFAELFDIDWSAVLVGRSVRGEGRGREVGVVDGGMVTLSVLW